MLGGDVVKQKQPQPQPHVHVRGRGRAVVVAVAFALQHHLLTSPDGVDVLCRAQENLGFCNWRGNGLGGVQECSAVVVIVEVSFTRKRVHARLIVSSVNIVFEVCAAHR